MKKAIFLFLLTLFLTGCGDSAGAEPVETEPPVVQSAETLPVAALEAEAAALAEEVHPPTGVVLEPVAPGIREERSDVAVVDYSNAEEGYIMAFYYGQTDKRLKLLLKGPTQPTIMIFPRDGGLYCLCPTGMETIRPESTSISGVLSMLW